jgi:hypothetical protein
VPTDAFPAPGRGFTVADIAARYRVSPDKVRAWIGKGLLRAVNRNDTRSGKPSWAITPEALAEFEQARQAVTLPPTPKRKKKTTLVDYYP